MSAILATPHPLWLVGGDGRSLACIRNLNILAATRARVHQPSFPRVSNQLRSAMRTNNPKCWLLDILHLLFGFLLGLKRCAAARTMEAFILNGGFAISTGFHGWISMERFLDACVWEANLTRNGTCSKRNDEAPRMQFLGRPRGRKEEKPLRWFSTEALDGPQQETRGEVRFRAPRIQSSC